MRKPPIPLFRERVRELHEDERGAYYAVELNDGYVCRIDVADFATVADMKWFAYRHRRYQTYVLCVGIGKPKTVSMHRILNGSPEGKQVDHRDGSGLNNRRYNFRVCTPSQNNSHRHNPRPSQTGYRGVHPTASGKFWAAISIGKMKTVSLGTFATAKEAARAWDKKAIELRGEFTFLNFPIFAGNAVE